MNKVCPDCAEEVKAAARVCRFCGFRFDASPEVENEPKEADPAASQPVAPAPDDARQLIVTSRASRTGTQPKSTHARVLAPFAGMFNSVAPERWRAALSEAQKALVTLLTLTLGLSIVAIVIAAAVSGGGLDGGGKSSGDGNNGGENSASPPPEQRCVDAWNAAPAEAQFLIGVVGQRRPIRYVSVGFSADYPDLCLITASNPDADVAMQFEEAQNSAYGGNYKPVGDPTSSNNLDPSVTNWNASADADGLITLYGTTSEGAGASEGSLPPATTQSTTTAPTTTTSAPEPAPDRRRTPFCRRLVASINEEDSGTTRWETLYDEYSAKCGRLED